MDNNPALYVSKEECSRHRKEIEQRLTQGSVDFAVIKTKLNIILGVLGVLGSAVAGVLVKMIFGT